jgi:hypothetical protein
MSVRVYRGLLWVYPPGFFREYRDAMVQFFCDSARDSLREAGIFGLCLVWVQLIPDLFVSCVQQHLRERQTVMSRAVLFGILCCVPAAIFWSCLVLGEFVGIDLARSWLNTQASLPDVAQAILWLGLPLLALVARLRVCRARGSSLPDLAVLAVATVFSVGMLLAAFARSS